MVPSPVVIGFVPDDYAVLSANGEPAAVVVMGDVVRNYRIRCPYFKSIHQPPFACLRIIITGTPFATDVACYGRRVRAGRTLYKDAASISRPAYPVAGDNAIIARERNPSALTNVFDDTPMARPDLVPLGDKNRTNRWPCSGHRPPNIVAFDRRVLTSEGDDRPTPDEAAATRGGVMPEAEITYGPFGTRHTPPPAALNAAVSLVTPSPTAPGFNVNLITFLGSWGGGALAHQAG
jgi:hypothetical protein